MTALVGDRLTDSWRLAFTSTPRELFIPNRALWVHDKDVKTPIDRDTDPDTWMTAVYSNDSIITQIDDGAVDGEGDYTSSSSMPAIMLAMLNHLKRLRLGPPSRAAELGSERDDRCLCDKSDRMEAVA